VESKPEVVQCAEANRISVLVFRKGLAVPGGRGETRSEDPGVTAVSCVSLGAIVGKSRMLRRRVEPNVVQYERREKGVNDFEGLDGAVEVLVIDGVFIVVHPGIWSCHLVTNKEKYRHFRDSGSPSLTVASGPGHDGRLLSHRVAHEIKGERLVDSNYAALTVRCVVIHVATRWDDSGTRCLRADDVFRFSKIGRPGV